MRCAWLESVNQRKLKVVESRPRTLIELGRKLKSDCNLLNLEQLETTTRFNYY